MDTGFAKKKKKKKTTNYGSSNMMHTGSLWISSDSNLIFTPPMYNSFAYIKKLYRKLPILTGILSVSTPMGKFFMDRTVCEP
jgi:hypothetical protein